MDEIISKIRTCLQCLHDINLAIDYDSTVRWFKKLCLLLSALLITIANYIKNCNSSYVQTIKKALLLYLTQLITLLSLLIKIFLNENDIKEKLNEARKFTTKQLETCLSAIEIVLHTGKIKEDSSGSFLKWMDLCLDKLAEIDVENDKENSMKHYVEARNCIEEVLCHAMSIAQVSLIDDCKIIKGSSKSVLEELDCLFAELNKDEFKINMCNLMIDSCYDKLCALERKVNCAVLRLSLKVFSQYTLPLEELNKYCLNRENIYDEEQFDNLVADFDMQVDRIMQIGLFAIVASTNFKSAVRMKSCLASLEALEGELVPSFNALLIKSTMQNKNFAFMLEQYWIQQAESLRELIYGIIDPFAFCQVVYEELKQHTDNLFENIKNNTLSAKMVNPILREIKVLVDLIGVATVEIGLDNLQEVNSNCAEIKIVLHELKSAVTLLLANKSHIDCTTAQRILKRVKILRGSVRKLLFSLSDCDLDEGKNKFNGGAEKLIEKSVILTKNDEKLNEIMHRGKELLDERSILYKTPTKKFSNNAKCKTSITKHTNHQKPLSLLKMVHLRNLQFSYSKIRSDASNVDLQVTDILADLETISSSFSTI